MDQNCHPLNQAPWSLEIVEALNHFQNNPNFHPYTCPNRSDGYHRLDAAGWERGILLATKAGWICPDCDYTQKWCHEVMIQIGKQSKETPREKDEKETTQSN